MFRSAFASARHSTRSFSSAATPKATTSYAIGAGLFGVAALSFLSYNSKSAEWFAKDAPKALTNPNEWVSLSLLSSEQVNHNTKSLKFALPSDEHIIGLNIASALLTKYKGPNDEKPTIRPYTPVSEEDARGYVELLVKRYEGGPMSTHLCEMKKDEKLEFKGPILKYRYEPNMHSTIGLIAGGTGITPMYQLIRAVMKNPEDKTKIVLVTANISDKDILLKEEFDELAKTHPDQFKAFHVLDNPPSGWKGESGRVSKDLLSKAFPGTDDKGFKAFICGP